MTTQTHWSPAQAHQWYQRLPWLVGCNYIPSTAVNQLEMWQAETFDPSTISRELNWAAGLGLNTVRVYLHDLPWQVDSNGFQQRINRFLELATSVGICTLLVLFDDCWNDDPHLGPQPAPIPGVHNSGWVQSPGPQAADDRQQWPRLQAFVQGVIDAFRDDRRVLMWDLYNEPGNSGRGAQSLPLLRQTFAWARDVNPSQPLTAGIWFDDPTLNAFQLEVSGVITFHNYIDLDQLAQQIQDLRKHYRPLICTEFMARSRNSRFKSHLPLFKQERVGCYNWGLVKGKTQTAYPWGSEPRSPEPAEWFHDILQPDGTPFDPAEVALIRRLARVS